jgi:hypothetical protein
MLHNKNMITKQITIKALSEKSQMARYRVQQPDGSWPVSWARMPVSKARKELKAGTAQLVTQ